MKTIDFSPSVSPSPEQQRDALKKGLGRAMEWAKAGRLADGLLLDACLHDKVFDRQCEDCRAEWLWNIMVEIGATEWFRQSILSAICGMTIERDAYQLCELAYRYARAGFEEFKSALYEIVERKPFPSDRSIGEEQLLLLDGAKAFQFVARVRGTALANREWDWEDGSIVDRAVEELGGEQVTMLLRGSDNAAARRFESEWRKNASETNPPSRESHDQKMRAIPVEQIIQAAKSEAKNYWFRGWGMHATETDLKAVQTHLWLEPNPKVIAKLLRVFSARSFPEFDSRLIALCKHVDQDVRRRALIALAKQSNPLIREFALAQLQNGSHQRLLVSLLVNNYKPGDERPILDALELPEDEAELHWLLGDVVEVLEKNPSANSSELAQIVYAYTPCQNCRFDAAKQLHRQGVAPGWLVGECHDDSEARCRTLFA